MPITQAEDAIARLDERLRLSPLAEGLRARVDYGETCASQLAEGELVHFEDLVLFDAGAFDGAISPALSNAFYYLQFWRRAQREQALSSCFTPRRSRMAAGCSRNAAREGWRA